MKSPFIRPFPYRKLPHNPGGTLIRIRSRATTIPTRICKAVYFLTVAALAPQAWQAVLADSSTEPAIGTYNMTVKVSDTSVSSDLSDDDVEATTTALVNTHQSLFGYDAGSPYYDPENPTVNPFASTVRATGAQGISMFGLVSERHLNARPLFFDNHIVTWKGSTPSYSAADDYFFDADGSCDPTDSFCYERFDPETRDKWLDIWVKYAKSLSRLSAPPGYESLIGWTIDDFGMYICAAHDTGSEGKQGCYTPPDEVRLIEQSGRTCSGCNSDFLFMPTIYLNQAQVGAVIAPGYEVGQPYETPSDDGDFAVVTFAFDLPGPPTAFDLSFLYTDGCELDTPASTGDSNSELFKDRVYKTVIVNDKIVWIEELYGAGDGAVRQEYRQVPPARKKCYCHRSDREERCPNRASCSAPAGCRHLL